jgi:hypothetical protein
VTILIPHDGITRFDGIIHLLHEHEHGYGYGLGHSHGKRFGNAMDIWIVEFETI